MCLHFVHVCALASLLARMLARVGMLARVRMLLWPCWFTDHPHPTSIGQDQSRLIQLPGLLSSQEGSSLQRWSCLHGSTKQHGQEMVCVLSDPHPNCVDALNRPCEHTGTTTSKQQPHGAGVQAKQCACHAQMCQWAAWITTNCCLLRWASETGGAPARHKQAPSTGNPHRYYVQPPQCCKALTQVVSQVESTDAHTSRVDVGADCWQDTHAVGRKAERHHLQDPACRKALGSEGQEHRDRHCSGDDGHNDCGVHPAVALVTQEASNWDHEREDDHAGQHHPQCEGCGQAHVSHKEGGQPGVRQVEGCSNPCTATTESALQVRKSSVAVDSTTSPPLQVCWFGLHPRPQTHPL